VLTNVGRTLHDSCSHSHLTSPQAVLSGHTIVVYEVSLSLLRLMRAHPHRLHPLEWDAIYDTLDAVLGHMSLIPGSAGNLVQCIRDIFRHIEKLYDGGANIGSPELFFGLVEKNIDYMPVSIVI